MRNREFIKINDYAIVSNEKGNLDVIEYSDNIEEILIQENIIEKLEDMIEDIEYNLKEYSNIKNYAKALLAICPTGLISALIVFKINNVDILSYIPYLTGITLVTTTIGVVSTFVFNKMYKKMIKEKNALEVELDKLNKRYDMEMDKSIELEDTRSKSSDIMTGQKVHDDDKMKELDKYLELCHNLGYNIEELSKAYERNRLDKEMKKYFTEEERNTYSEEVKEYVREYQKKIKR